MILKHDECNEVAMKKVYIILGYSVIVATNCFMQRLATLNIMRMMIYGCL